jgi:electron transport complex protein RnfC
MLCGDRRAASQFTADLGWGIALLKHLLGGSDAVLLVHGDDYKNIMRTLREFSGIDLVDSAPELYPDNLPELLVKKYFNREVPMNGTAADVDVAVVRAETVVAAIHAVRDGKPHTHKIVSVTGSGVYWPRLLSVPIGMTIGDVVAACGGLKTGVEYLVVGGPLRGWANYDKNVPVTHETDAIIALPNGNGKLPAETPCINCGDCVQACPVNLQPNLLSRFCEFNQYEGAAAAGLDACIECGMCGYVCPALRPMLQFLRTAKHEIAEAARKQAELDALAAAAPVPQEPDAQPEAFKPGAEATAEKTVAATENSAGAGAPALQNPEEKVEEKAENTPAEPAGDTPAADAGEQKSDGEKTPES